MISFTGCVYDKETKEPIKDSSVLVAYKYDPFYGYFVIIKPGNPNANLYSSQEVKTGNDGCFSFKTSNELERKLLDPSVSNRRIVVFSSGYITSFTNLKYFIKEENKPIYLTK